MDKRALSTLLLAVWILCLVSVAYAGERPPVYLGLDAEVGHMTSTSDDAIKRGILIAIEEINASGGVLGGRKLELVVRDNRSVPARGVKNVRELAEIKDLVAVYCGKFSPVAIEVTPVIHELKLILLDPWAAADVIIDNGQKPNYAFRLSLRDSWAVDKMLDYARSRGLRRIGVLLPITSWGRSNDTAIKKYKDSHAGITIVDTEWYNWGDKTMLPKYQALRAAGADAVLLVSNEAEASILIREMGNLTEAERLPIISHWGITGGDFVALAGEALRKVDFHVVQTYSFIGATGSKAKQVIGASDRLFGTKGARDIKSPVGLAHAYDLTHILALALDHAGTTDRAAVRDSLEQVRGYDGLIKHYSQPFTRERHEALNPEDIIMARYDKDGALVPVAERP